MAHFKEKRLDVAAEASLQPWTACPGTKIAPRQSVCHHHDGAPHGTSRSRMRPCSPTVPQAGAPVSARSFCTSPCGRHGNGHWAQLVCRTKGALGVPQAPRWPPALTVCRCRGKHRTYPRFPPGPAACVPAGHDSRLRTACHAPRQTGNSLNRNVVSLTC